MAATRRTVRKKLAQAERDRDARKEMLAQQRQLRTEVSQLWITARNSPSVPPREELVILSSVEALVDQLAELGLIDRVRHNILTFTNMKRRITNALNSSGGLEVVSEEADETGAAV